MDNGLLFAGGLLATLGGHGLILWRGSSLLEQKVTNLHEHFTAEIDRLREEIEEIREEAKVKSESWKEELTDFVRDFKKATEVLQGLVTDIKVFNAEQSTVNRVTTSALKGLTSKVEENSKMANENAANISLMREMLTQVHRDRKDDRQRD